MSLYSKAFSLKPTKVLFFIQKCYHLSINYIDSSTFLKNKMDRQRKETTKKPQFVGHIQEQYLQLQHPENPLAIVTAIQK